MAKTRQQKQEMVDVISQNLQSAKSAVFANFQGLKMEDIDTLRGICKEQDVYYTASKKTLVKIALQNAGFDIDTKEFEGGVAVFLGMKDEVTPAQIVAKFAKDHDVVKVFGGILEGQFIDSAKVSQLSALPSKQQLLGQLVGTLNAPVSGFVNVLAGNLRGLANVLNAIKDQKPA